MVRQINKKRLFAILFDEFQYLVSQAIAEVVSFIVEIRVFGEAKEPDTAKVDVTRRHAKIGELSLERDFLESALSKAGLLSARR